MISNYLDHGDEKKARRSLLTVATITLAAASMEILDGQVSILGLTIAVKQARLVALGQIACGVLLFVFLIRSLPIYLELLKEMSLRQLKRREIRSKTAWEEEWLSPAEGEDGPQGEFREIEEYISQTRANIVERYSTLSFVFGAAAIFLVDFGLPLTVGFLGTAHPHIISDYIDQIVASEPNVSPKALDEEAALPTAENTSPVGNITQDPHSSCPSHHRAAPDLGTARRRPF